MEENPNQALIIDIEDVDEQQMTEVLQSMGFNCTGYGSHNIQDGEDLCEFIDLFVEELKKLKTKGKLEHILVFISTHGGEKLDENTYDLRLKMGNGKTVSANKDIIRPFLFDKEGNEEFKGIPKIFILQCCRRHEGDTVDAATDQGVRIVACSDEEEEYTIVEVKETNDNGTTNDSQIDRIQPLPTKSGYSDPAKEPIKEYRPLYSDDCVVVFSTPSGRISSLTNEGGILACAMREVMGQWDKDSVPFLSFMLEVNRHLCGISRKISSDVQSSVKTMDQMGVEERSDPEDMETNITNTEGENMAQTLLKRSMEKVQVCDAKAEDGFMNVLDYNPCASIVHTLTKDIVFSKCHVHQRNPSQRRKRHRNPNVASNNEKGDMI